MIVYRVLDAVRSFCKEACALGQARPETGLMTGTNTKLTAAVEAYFGDLGRVRASGGATGERSSYGPLANLLNAVGATLKPKVFCVVPTSASTRRSRCSGAALARGGRQIYAPSRRPSHRGRSFAGKLRVRLWMVGA